MLILFLQKFDQVSLWKIKKKKKKWEKLSHNLENNQYEHLVTIFPFFFPQSFFSYTL